MVSVFTQLNQLRQEKAPRPSVIRQPERQSRQAQAGEAELNFLVLLVFKIFGLSPHSIPDFKNALYLGFLV